MDAPGRRSTASQCSRSRSAGAAAISRVVRHLIEEGGHHRITLDPAVDNVAAIRCYEKAGFRRVGVMRRAERDVDGDGWHDALLMELLATDERARRQSRFTARSQVVYIFATAGAILIGGYW